MADFDPAFRHETQCFVRRPSANRGFNRHKRLERLKFNIVHYDDSVDGYIEPLNISDLYPGLGTSDTIDMGSPAASGYVVGFQIFDTAQQPFDGLHQFD
jgi:hypothetical protein